MADRTLQVERPLAMQRPGTPAHEAQRLNALQCLGLLDTPRSESFDRITRLAAETLDVPIVLVSLVDEARQWFKSRVGLDATETSREVSFCAHAICNRQLLNVPDATRDPRFAGNPLVTGAPHIRAYIGVPLYSRAGHAIGTLCAIDTRPRGFFERHLQTIGDLAKILEDHIHSIESAHDRVTAESLFDPLTGLSNRRAFIQGIDSAAARLQASEQAFGLILIDIDDFKLINDRCGHEAGDEVLGAVGRILQQQLRDTRDLVARFGGDEFALLCFGALSDERLRALAETLRHDIGQQRVTSARREIAVTASLGHALGDARDGAWQDLYSRADTALYEAKSAGKDRVAGGQHYVPGATGRFRALRAVPKV